MNYRAISAMKASIPTRVHLANPMTPVSEVRPGLSRRQFTRTAAGTAVVGATLGSALWTPALAAPKGAFAPVPIPGGSPVLGGSYHVFGPAAFDPVDAEPVTITNLDAFVGLAYISGMVTQTNVKTGEKARYPFVDSDMRFMEGNFRGTDGRLHQATFAFI
ncbi:MAG TPA: hypothetical protein VK776_15335 [Bryobacteraceae bacterium]|nr:hypothetical protein [Bryobacteraceae bacterium]